jgi:SET domain-containing protein
LREIKAKHGNPDWFADPQINYLNEMNLKECKIKESEKFIIEFYTLREIEIDEELCHNYGGNYWTNKNKKII